MYIYVCKYIYIHTHTHMNYDNLKHTCQYVNPCSFNKHTIHIKLAVMSYTCVDYTL